MKQLTPEQLEDKMNRTLSKFDFEKVLKVMHFVDWKYNYDERGYHLPTLEELKKIAKGLLHSTYLNLLIRIEVHDQYWTWSALAGFQVEWLALKKEPELEPECYLYFILANSQSKTEG